MKTENPCDLPEKPQEKRSIEISEQFRQFEISCGVELQRLAETPPSKEALESLNRLAEKAARLFEESGGEMPHLSAQILEIKARLIGELSQSEDLVLECLAGEEFVKESALKKYRTIVLNPGSTSTKLGIYEGFRCLANTSVAVSKDKASTPEGRAAAIMEWLNENGYLLSEFDGIASRAGFCAQVAPKTYLITPELLSDLENARSKHASNFGLPIAQIMAAAIKSEGKKQDVLITTSYPVASDEIDDLNAVSGIKELLKTGSGAHYLNHKAMWNYSAKLLDVRPEKLTLITAHLGGGNSVALHYKGRIVDIINAFSGLPSANRCGNLPITQLIEALETGKLSLTELKEYAFGRGGLIDLADTDDFKALEHYRNHGATAIQQKKIDLILDFYARSIAGGILSLAANAKPSLVVLTGGLAYSDLMSEKITSRLNGFIPSARLPGSLEHQILHIEHLKAAKDRSYAADYGEEKRKRIQVEESRQKLLATQIFPENVYRMKEGSPLLSAKHVINMAKTMAHSRRLPIIGIVNADNHDALIAAKMANEQANYHLARFALIGDYNRIMQRAWDYDIYIDNQNYFVVDTQDPIKRALELYDEGALDMLMKGSLKTEELMRGIFQHQKAKAKLGELKRVWSHVVAIDLPSREKLVMITDGALNTYPDEEKLYAIINNSLAVCEALNVHKPKVALLSAIEAVNPSIESSIHARAVAERFKDYPHAIVEGPLSFDVAMGVEQSKIKGYSGQIQGDADVLVVPNIDTGNAIYKTMTVSSKATAMGVIVGGEAPTILTSRGDDAQTKLASMSLAILLFFKHYDEKLKKQ